MFYFINWLSKTPRLHSHYICSGTQHWRQFYLVQGNTRDWTLFMMPKSGQVVKWKLATWISGLEFSFYYCSVAEIQYGFFRKCWNSDTNIKENFKESMGSNNHFTKFLFNFEFGVKYLSTWIPVINKSIVWIICVCVWFQPF